MNLKNSQVKGVTKNVLQNGTGEQGIAANKGVFTCKISYRYELYWYEIFHRYHVNKYRAISKNRDELVPE